MLIKLFSSLGLLAYGASGDAADVASITQRLPAVEEGGLTLPESDAPPQALPEPVKATRPGNDRKVPKKNVLKKRHLVDAKNKVNHAKHAQSHQSAERPHEPREYRTYFKGEPRTHYDGVHNPRIRDAGRELTPAEYQMALNAYYNELNAQARDYYMNYGPYGYPAYYGDAALHDDAAYYNDIEDPYYGYFQESPRTSYSVWFEVFFLAIRLAVWICLVVFASMFAYQKWNKTILPWLQSRNQAHTPDDIELADSGRGDVLVQK